MLSKYQSLSEACVIMGRAPSVVRSESMHGSPHAHSRSVSDLVAVGTTPNCIAKVVSEFV